MFETLNEKYTTLSKFFETMIQNKDTAVPNSIILHGPDVIAQYFFALQLARGANCYGEKDNSCNCQNCSWIKSSEHPEVMTISKINSKPEKDDSKTVISVAQIDSIKDKLVSTSDYHRFFIFCDAEERDFTEEEKIQYSSFEKLGIKFPNFDKGWVPLGLTRKCFSEVVANALLKVVEEPPENVTFIFLTENIENIISTIVSRSQAFYVLGNSKQNYDFLFLKEQFSNYPNIDKNKALIISDYLLKIAKERNESLYSVLMGLQAFLMDLLKENANSRVLKNQILSDFEKLQNLVNMSKAGVKDNVIADEVGYILTR